MRIREVHECDRVQLLQLLGASSNSWTFLDLDRFEEWMMTPNQYTYVGIIDDTIVVTQTITIEHKLTHDYGKVAHSEDLVVMKCYQGKGLAKQMMDYCIEICKRHKVYKLIATCSKDMVEYYIENLGVHEHEVGIRRDFR